MPSVLETQHPLLSGSDRYRGIISRAEANEFGRLADDVASSVLLIRSGFAHDRRHDRALTTAAELLELLATDVRSPLPRKPSSGVLAALRVSAVAVGGSTAKRDATSNNEDAAASLVKLSEQLRRIAAGSADDTELEFVYRVFDKLGDVTLQSHNRSAHRATPWPST